jgi:hypothetical protein
MMLPKHSKSEVGLRGLKRIPGKVAHAYNVESRVLHDGDSLVDLLWGTVDRADSMRLQKS